MAAKLQPRFSLSRPHYGPCIGAHTLAGSGPHFFCHRLFSGPNWLSTPTHTRTHTLCTWATSLTADKICVKGRLLNEVLRPESRVWLAVLLKINQIFFLCLSDALFHSVGLLIHTYSSNIMLINFSLIEEYGFCISCCITFCNKSRIIAFYMTP